MARNENVIPDADESKKFWSDIWSVTKEHNRNAEWLNNIRNDIGDSQQGELEITAEMVSIQCRKMPNWKAPGRDGVQGFWLKNLRSFHGRLAEQLNNLLNGEEELPEWLAFGRTMLCLKDPTKGNAFDNFRPISCLPLMWKLITGVIAEVMYEYLEEILPKEQNGSRRRIRGTKDQLLLDKAILKDCNYKRRHTNLAMSWVDYRSWIVECLKMFGIAANVKQFLLSSMEGWKTELTSCGQTIGGVDINMGIFQGDSLSPLLFVLCMVPLSFVLITRSNAGYV